jgi:predicted DCC family thiol-disulfide oxidoreductase YuxK
MDRAGQFRFAPLTGDLAVKLLTPILPDYLKEDTIICYDEGNIYLRSEAALQILVLLGFPYNLGYVGKVIPRSWRDGIYRWVANRRFRYGKRYDVCPMPPEKWKERFIF